MSRAARIEELINKSFSPHYLEIENESHKHSRGVETHYRVLLVSKIFEGLSRVDRQRRVYSCLESELNSGLHALALQLMTEAEWEQSGQKIHLSPACQGGGGEKLRGS